MTQFPKPPPLTPPDCDLRDFPFMPLDVVRLRDSDISAISTGDEFRCAVLLWCASWHQVPAASIPDDDIVLAQLAGFGRVVKEWKKVRDGALRGWIKCDDGRLYHPVVAEKAAEAWVGRVKYREKKEADRVRLAEKRAAEKRVAEEKEAQKSPPPQQNKAVDNPKNGELSQPQTEDVAATSKNVAATNQESEATNTASRGDNGLIGTVDSGQWTVDRDSNKSSQQNPPPKSDDLVPSSPAEWLQFFGHEHGIDIDHRSVHDRKKFWPLATAWAKAGVTVGQMRQAIAKAQTEAKEPIAFLPAYADRVLASQTAKAKPNAQSRHHGINETNFQEGVSADGRF